MAVKPVPSMTAIPPFPALSDRAAGTYNSKAFEFGTHLATKFNAEFLALAGNVRDNATDAATSASTANTRANAAAGSASAAAESAGVAEGHSNTALERANLAGQRAGAAADSATAAAGSATASEASRIQADKRYLGAKAGAPTKDNQGAALQAGAVYYDTTAKKVMTWDGNAWVTGITATVVTGVESVDGMRGELTTKRINGASIFGSGDLTVGMKKVTRTLPTKLLTADNGTWFSLSGSMMQPFDTPALLGNTWSCFISNDGTGNITIPASDGRTNWIMYPGEARIFFSDGAAITSYVLRAYCLRSQSSGTFIKPPGYNHHQVRGIGGGQGGGGGGGGASGSFYAGLIGGSGGSGGAGGVSGVLAEALFPDAAVPNSVPWFIGAGGIGGAGGTGGAAQTSGANGFNGSSGKAGSVGNPTTFGTQGTTCFLAADGGNASANGGTPGYSAGGGPSVLASGATPLTATSAGAAVISYPAVPGGDSVAGMSGTPAANGVTSSTPGAGGQGGSSSSSPVTVTVVSGAVGGTGTSVRGVAGGNGANVATKAAAGCGGAGGGGGSGSAGAGASGTGNAASAKAGDGGNGGQGGDGQIEITGFI